MDSVTTSSPIRLATKADLPAVNALLRQVLAVHHAGRPDLFRAHGKKYTDEELLDIFRNPLSPVFVYDDGRVLGYVFCVLQQSGSGSLQEIKTLYIDDLCVDEAARGRGIGRELFEFAKEFARSQGCHNLTLHVWEANPAARAFYEKMGLQVQYTSLETVL